VPFSSHIVAETVAIKELFSHFFSKLPFKAFADYSAFSFELSALCPI
jgi:hypothetical protein